jgi:flagellar biosynthesis/type III secretory pathway ATPase
MIALMKGITLQFKKRVEVTRDDMNNPVTNIVGIEVDDCLIAPYRVPTELRENQAITQTRDEVEIHLPKDFDGDLADSYVAWDGKIYQLDSGGEKYMDENTPTRWNRNLRGESVAQYDPSVPDVWLEFFASEDGLYEIDTEAGNKILSER